MPKLIVGLGNPGREYELTRHNIGFLTLDYLGDQFRLQWKEKFKGFYAVTTIGDEQFIFLKPQTYMNLSGESVQPCAKFFKVDNPDILVVHDELDLDFGAVSLKNGGGLAGHNGLKSIAKLMGGNNFLRLRLGIGRPKYGDVSNHVLSPFNEEEDPYLEDFIELGGDAVKAFCEKGFSRAANSYSKKSIKINQ